MSFARVATIMVVVFLLSAVAIVAWPIAQSLPEASDHAAAIDFLFKFMLVASAAVFIIVQGFILYFVFRYRRRADEPADALGTNIHGNTRLELVWSAIPAIFLVILTAMSWKVYTDIVADHSGSYIINAHAFQYGWTCSHPDYPLPKSSDPAAPTMVSETATCHMPEGRYVTVNLHSEDVIHSFWVPEFRVKQDAVPGYPTRMHFKTTQIGHYRLICAEFCGVAHSEMYAQLYICPTSVAQARASAFCDHKTFDEWARDQQKQQSGGGSLANVSFKTDIESLFGAHCAACHVQNKLGGLNLGNYQGLVQGGAVLPGSVIKPGKHAQSYLWQIVQPKAPWPAGARMPLGGPYLAPADIAKIQAWIDQGAKDN